MTRRQSRSDSSVAPVIGWRFMMLVLAFVISAVQADDPPRVIIPRTATYANKAWGYSGGGKDSLSGMEVVLVDLDETTEATIASYKAEGRIVQCYFSVGTAETFRPDYTSNKNAWKSLGLGSLPQFPDEFWLDLTKLDAIKALMEPRFWRAMQKGCDAIEPDNTDCYDNSECNNPIKQKAPNFNVKAKQIEYCKWQVALAHSLGMAISLKNSLAIIPDLVNYYDFAVNEQCNQYSECSSYMPFINQGKAVFNHEYQLGPGSTYCSSAVSLHIQTKRCAGKPADGICTAASSWVNCFDPLTTLPPRKYTNGTGIIPPLTSRPSKAPTTRPSKSPTVPAPSRGPTRYPTRRPTRHRRRG